MSYSHTSKIDARIDDLSLAELAEIVARLTDFTDGDGSRLVAIELHEDMGIVSFEVSR